MNTLRPIRAALLTVLALAMAVDLHAQNDTTVLHTFINNTPNRQPGLTVIELHTYPYAPDYPEVIITEDEKLTVFTKVPSIPKHDYQSWDKIHKGGNWPQTTFDSMEVVPVVGCHDNRPCWLDDPLKDAPPIPEHKRLSWEEHLKGSVIIDYCPNPFENGHGSVEAEHKGPLLIVVEPEEPEL